MKCLSLRKLLNNVFKRNIKQILFEILASEDCYIDLPVIVQKVKLNLFSVSMYSLIFNNIVFVYLQSLVSRRNRCKLQFVIPLVYQWSIVIVVNFSLLKSSCCFRLYLVVPSYPGSQAWVQDSAFFFFLRLFTNRRLVSTAHASLMHACDTWNLQTLSS